MGTQEEEQEEKEPFGEFKPEPRFWERDFFTTLVISIGVLMLLVGGCFAVGLFAVIFSK